MSTIKYRTRTTTEDYENRKFTDTGLVRNTSFSGPIVEIDYDANENPTEIREYTANREITAIKNLVDDVSGSLNNKHFLLSNAGDTTDFYLWLNVGGAGTDPSVAGRTPIEVAVPTNSTASQIVDLAVAEINTNHSTNFLARRIGSQAFRIEALDYLATTATTDVDTGFTFEQTAAGAVKTLKVQTFLTYDGNENVTNIRRNEYV